MSTLVYSSLHSYLSWVMHLFSRVLQIVNLPIQIVQLLLAQSQRNGNLLAHTALDMGRSHGKNTSGRYKPGARKGKGGIVSLQKKVAV